MSRIDIAVARFEEGCSCAQAIFSTYAESLGVDRQTAMKLSSGFGGGMGRMALTCGTPTPATTLVVQMDPGPTPTLIPSAPASISA